MNENSEQTITESKVGVLSEALTSWNDFKTFVSNHFLKEPNRYVFRGHGDEKWKLESSFDRTFQSLDDDERDEMYKGLLRLFRRECVHYPEYEDYLKEDRDDSKLMALAQHHGLPTRLLDWSDSPYVAAYFAFRYHLGIDRGPNDSGRDHRVAIWVLDTNARRYWAGNAGVELIEPIPWHNERQRRQSGRFTYARMPFRTLEEYVLAMGAKQNPLRKLSIPSGEAGAALADLNMMRINARELFADLQGGAINALMNAVLADKLPA